MQVTAPRWVHPLALCESDRVGNGTRIWPFAHVMSGAAVGRECNIGEHVFVEDGASIGDRVTVKNAVQIWDRVTIEDDVFVGPNVVFTNDLRPRIGYRRGPDELVPTLVRHGATIGAGVTVVCGVTVGSYAFVGAGSVVTRDVLDHELVVGNPARPFGWVCQCAERLPEDLTCSCGLRYRRAKDGISPRR